MQQLQLQARAQAAGSNNLDPNHPGQQLPAVADGLRPGGLQINGAPTGADAPTEAVAGSGHTTVTIKQRLQQAFLEWQTFNVGRDTTVHFDQTQGGKDAGQWIAFNHVKDPTGVPSQILGQIKAEGQVYILNQNGIIFGNGSQVDVHTLVASALPINTNLVNRGLLNNPDVQYLFSALPIAAGAEGGTPAFTPELNDEKKIGDVTVESGARLTAPTTADKVGGRIALVGANVTNDGTIFTPDGQTILAAGLQVGMVAHSSSDPSLRGLDVYVGSVADSVVGAFAGSAGTVTNNGHIDSPRGNITLAGKTLDQDGALTATTSVSFNGRIDLNASYGAVSNPAYDPTNSAFGAPFLFSSAGTITLGEDSVTQITPELSSTEKVVGTELALSSQINMMGEIVHLERNAMVLAPNADITINAGVWDLASAGGTLKSSFVRSNGQVYMDSGSSINVAGTTDVVAQMAENILTLQLRGSEFADFSYNRDGSLRGVDITLDVRRQGIFEGTAWAGTPLANASGFIGLIQRGVDQLTTAGGTVKINSGGSVVMQTGSSIDVSGGYINYLGGMVQTTRVAYGSQIFDISEATPDRVYEGIYTGTFTTTSAKWGVSKDYTVSLLLGSHYEAGYTYGAAGGSISINAPSMALDGELLGNTINGTRQRELQAAPSSLSLTFQGQRLQAPLYPTYSPAPPTVVFQSGVLQQAANPFALDANGHAVALRDDRVQTVVLSPELLSENGFGQFTVENKDGDIIVSEGELLVIQPKGSITLSGANITVNGSITTPGGSITLNAYNISPSVADELKQSANPVTPAPSLGRGLVTLGADASLDTAGMFIDDRLGRPDLLSDVFVLDGGNVTINGYSANLSAGSAIDVGGGARMDWFNDHTYGDAGSIVIRAGQDRSLPWVQGGDLVLGAELLGMAGPGRHGGALTVQAPLIQIGGSTSNSDVLLLQPDFFSQGGFSSHTLNGLGQATGLEQYIPGLAIAPGTVIDPVVQNFLYEPVDDGNGPLVVTPVTLPQSLRSPLSLSFGALGSTDDFSRVLEVRGDLVFGEGAVIRAGLLGSVELRGDTVTVLGSIFTPGGLIDIRGADRFLSLDPNPTQALATVYIGPDAHLSAAGAVVLTPDPFGRRIGDVLSGGTISVSGNIVAEQGAVLDVSGTSGELDLEAAALALTTVGGYLDGSPNVPYSSGLTTPVSAITPIRTTVDSSGGLIHLKGGQELFTRATLLGDAGGATATGGSLSISSGRFYESGVIASPNDLNLMVTQSRSAGAFFAPGQTAIGQANTGSPGLGYFAANDFLNGGFDNLQLGGNVGFSGAVGISARGSMIVATGGVIFANSDVNLTASYIALGTVFAPPMLPTQVQNPFSREGQPFFFPPTFGPGNITVEADLIDIGSLSLQNIGNASFVANDGDIRGDGTFNIAGDLVMRAAQVYPVTGTTFTIAAYDHGGIAGSVSFEKSGVNSLPLSAGGTLNVYASNIAQNGVLRAPFGVINLGWDGTGTAPKDLITGSTLALPATRTLTLGASSITSVSAIDPITNKGVLMAYGTSPNGTSWIDPAGLDITSSGLPAKAINLAGASIETQAGSSIDLRGGGDLFAYRFVSGTNGTQDILGNSGAFAVIPGYAPFFAPYGAFNSNSAASNLNGAQGYTNSSLKVGDQVFLGGGGGLSSGVYTLLPARYALMPGAFLVTPQSGNPTGSLLQPDGASFVNGYQFNSLNHSRTLPGLYSNFEVAPAATVARRAQYDLIFANEFLTKYATERDQVVQRLPQDSGQLVLAATAAMALNGSVLSPPVGAGRGGLIDISSPVDIVISAPGAAAIAGRLVLDSTQLTSFGAGSLLIGGVRSSGPNGTTINVKTDNVTVANFDPSTGEAAPLAGSEIILVAKKKLTVEAGSAVRQSGTLSGSADTLLLGNTSVNGSGDGTLLRVSSDANAEIQRSGVSSTATTANMVIGAGAGISGNSVTIDSTYATTLNGTAIIDGKSVSLNSGQISLQLTSPGALQTTKGLVLTGAALDALQSATSLSLLSYTTIDIYGVGGVGSSSLLNLALHAGEIRGFNTDGGTATLQAQNIVVDNSANGRALGPVNGTLSGTLLLDAQTVRIAENSSRVSQYANLTMNATKGLFVEGEGGLSAAGAITANTPFISAARSSTQSLSAAGALTINNIGGATTTVSGLGASLSLQGSSVNSASDIILPSGVINITATTGNLTVAGRLDVSGTQQGFYDLIKFTNGGSITLGAANGNVIVNGSIDVGAHANGGTAGMLVVNAARGALTLNGTLRGKGGASFALDVGAMATTSALNTTLNTADFSGARSFRVRTGDVIVNGTSTSHAFNLSADTGKIDVTGTIDASGTTGGTINLMAAKGLTIQSGALLDVSGTTYDSAGKGGMVSLETQGAAAGYVSIDSGSTIDLGITATARLGQFSGTLHLRAPQFATANDLFVRPVNGNIIGASSITAEGFKIYDLTGTGILNTTVQNQILANGNSLGANDIAIANALFTGANAALRPLFSLQVGAEIINRTGDLTLGATNPGAGSSAWSLAAFRFGSKQSAGVLTLRAAGNLVFNEALSDGFVSGAYNSAMLNNNAALSDNAESWSYRLVAGADLAAADFRQVVNGTGSLMLGRNAGDANEIAANVGTNARTALAVAGFYQVIRTGSGSIDIATGKDVQLLNQFATIYTAGTKVGDPTLGGTFDIPILDFAGGASNLGGVQQTPAYAVQYSLGGGNVTINAGNDIVHLTRNAANQLVADSSRQLPVNWLYRRGYVDPATGAFGTARFGDTASTTWWVDFSNFFEGVGALGGGNVTMKAGRDIANVDAVVPTNARMPKSGQSGADMVELGGGDLVIRTGRNLDAGVYYVERGKGSIDAGGSVITNGTRSPSLTNLADAAPNVKETWLPTTLFVGKSSFDVKARGDLLIGPVSNPFLLPGGYSNSFWYKTYFSTYSQDAGVEASSLSGDVTLRESTTLPTIGVGGATPILLAWIQNALLFNAQDTNSAAFYHPWLRLNESKVDSFSTVAGIMPGTLKVTAFSGSINLVGNVTLSPSSSGTLDLAAAGAVNALQINGETTTVNGIVTKTWGTSRINVSDASPDSIPGVATPFAFQTIGGLQVNLASASGDNFLTFIDSSLRESGSTIGIFGVLQTKQALHAQGILHANDLQPLHIYAGGGDISGLTVFSPKAARIVSSQDIRDVALYIQNTDSEDVSVVSSGRDIILYDANSILRNLASSTGNVLNFGENPLSGDIQISGPGTLQVLAGRNLDLGTGSNNSDGTGVGITSIGNGRNPSLPFEGANIIAGAGIGPSYDLTNSALKFDAFIAKYIAGADGAKYLSDYAKASGSSISTLAAFNALDGEEQKRVALEIFYIVLRNSGRDHTATGDDYTAGFDAIATLFPGTAWKGDIKTQARDIRTKSGGNIGIFTPGGGLQLATAVIGQPLAPPGIITESGGAISIFADKNVDIGISRIFTLRGGNEILWSSHGDIAAGSSSKTVQSAPPTRVVIDPQSGDVKTDLAGLATGGGIGVLATVAGVAPGSVDLIAPNGTIDAGDAGIRATGNLNIAALTVLNANNISVGGTSSGAPSGSVAAPNVGGLTSSSNTAAAAGNTGAPKPADQAKQGEQTNAADIPSIMSVEVLGYGGGEDEDEEEKKRKRARRAL